MVPRRKLLALAVASLVLAVGSAEGLAQFTPYAPYYRPAPQRGPQPPISPYLNLLRGTNPAVNYYLGVRSEVDLRRLQQQVLLGEERRAPVPEDVTLELFPKLASTGHPAVFMNYGTYYSFGYGPGVQQPAAYAGQRVRR